MDKFELFHNVEETVGGYQKFKAEHQKKSIDVWEDISICDKQNYLLSYPITELIRKDSFEKCFLIGASSGFSKSGSVLWLKQSEDEEAYIEQVKGLLVHDYQIDKKSTLIIVSLALGTWIGGMQLASAMRSMAGKMDGVVSATPGINLKESVHIVEEFGAMFDQIVWVTNPSSINIIYSLLKDNKDLMDAKIYFPVVGEYFTESFRETISKKFGHNIDHAFVVKTGYGSADTGDLGIESEATIKLRKYLNNNPKISFSLFDDENPPMFFIKNDEAYLETIEGNLIVTKDQLVPLIRYDTHDTGGLLQKKSLKEANFPEAILADLPDEILYIFGRTSDSVIFYGTNLNIYDSGDFLNSLDESYAYGGLFEVEKTTKENIDFIEFTIYVLEEKKELEQAYQEVLINSLKASSNEFAAKYDELKSAIHEDLIRVNIKLVTEKNNAVKHHTIRR